MNKYLLFILALTLGSTTLAKIEIQNPWVKPSKGPNTSLFMKIINTGDKPNRLVDVQDNASLLVEFHENTKTQGKLYTTSVNYFAIPPKGNMQFNPGESHIMLENINRTLKVGDVVQMTLFFSDGQKINLNVPVKDSPTGTIQPKTNSLFME
jgi:copper(I)-binding protein